MFKALSKLLGGFFTLFLILGVALLWVSIVHWQFFLAVLPIAIGFFIIPKSLRIYLFGMFLYGAYLHHTADELPRGQEQHQVQQNGMPEKYKYVLDGKGAMYFSLNDKKTNEDQIVFNVWDLAQTKIIGTMSCEEPCTRFTMQWKGSPITGSKKYTVVADSQLRRFVKDVENKRDMSLTEENQDENI